MQSGSVFRAIGQDKGSRNLENGAIKEHFHRSLTAIM
jgi:hypothetical protein|tara:strand:+ start:176 stop:286 length:111 start_codon:yes stop_codon:yes gene_type:complete